MVVIVFADREIKRKAVAFLAGRYSFKSWASGELMVPKDALAALACEGIEYTSRGPATYDKILAALRDSSAASV